ncbi:MAG TPA: hypothetical protein DE315_01580 [Candidatus Omnitrophica bacterium]|nr:MAG: hypothetical protein A2Y05_03775 [Omnitrophica WOR_2 bacterium GWA2_53_43]HBO98151.1 hypothetical protein [Candidatus Omnitrophota bacterium]HCI44211.1 hypothetical protein [Candidatus Omnitrophota bacterium]
MPRKVLRHIFVSFFTIFLSHTFVTPDCRAYPTGSSQQGTSGPGKEVLSAPAYVDSGNFEADIVEQFVRQGMKCFQQKDTRGAIDHFARALLLDPANKTARDNLARISAQTSLPAPQRIQLFLCDDLLTLNENLLKKLDYFTVKRDALAAALIRQNYPQASIDQKFQAIRNRFILPADNQRKDAGTMSPLETLNKSLVRDQERLTRELQSVRGQISWLQEAPKRQPQTASHVKTSGSGEPWQQIADVREGLNELRRQVNALQEDVQHKDSRIAALTKQVVEFSLKLTEQEMIVSEKVTALSSLHDAYADLQSRQELGQKILEEKNTQIQSLQEGLAALQADTAVHTREINSLIAAKDQALDQWEKILSIYQGKLKDATETIEVRNADVTALKEQLAMVRAKLFEKETALEKTKEKLAGLEKQFQSVVSDPQ